ncbi:hypothetical protein GCM10023148_29380 [Actinokineospora soli]
MVELLLAVLTQVAAAVLTTAALHAWHALRARRGDKEDER